MSQNMVDLVDFVILSEGRLKMSNICVSEKLVDKVDFGLAPKSKYVHVSKRG